MREGWVPEDGDPGVLSFGVVGCPSSPEPEVIKTIKYPPPNATGKHFPCSGAYTRASERASERARNSLLLLL
jgi:hypothetical protein